jgi:predicted metal-dependent hydrolase
MNLPSSAQVSVRNLRFAIDDANVPRFWHGGRKSVTAFFDNLSLFFPVGERFFVATVRAHQHHVKDEALQKDVRAFCAQEGIHGREHERYNAMLRVRYPAAAMERRVTKLLDRVSRTLPKRFQLAATCALEHFTALMGQFLLEDPRMLEGAHPAMAALWRWHAAEENEHKAVAFDVFEAAGGTYGERVLAMVGASAIFWAKVLEHQVRMMAKDGTVFSPREWSALVWYLGVEPGGLRNVVRHYFAYYRPGFHPSQIDSSGQLEAWKSELASSSLYSRAAA